LSRLIAGETGTNGVKLNRLTSLINEANREAGTKCFVNRKMLARSTLIIGSAGWGCSNCPF
jgi:hypothetical protein